MAEQRIRVVPEWRPEPDLRLYVLALIALARQLEEEASRKDTETDAGDQEANND